ncbi:MAG: hypothetical protein ACE5FU_03815, partial [Nitrospinota bacterium]
YCANCHADGTLHPGEVERLVIGEQEGGKTNLTNDHPIGVLYRGAGDTGQSASLRARTTVISSIDMSVEQEDGSLLEPLVSGNLWAVKGFITNTATIQDLLKGSTGGAGNYVQCSSCHDPHYKNQTNPEADFYTSYGNDPNAPGGWPGQRVVTDHADFRIDGLFLRRVGGNSDSGVCRTCHNK